MSVKLSPIFNSQIVDASGNPATGWKIYTYVAGSSTPLATYTTSAGNVAQSNPIIIDSLGFPTVGQIWLTAGSTYKLVLTDSNDVVKKTEDNVSGVNDSSISQDEWLDSGVTPTYVSATSFTLVGDQTSAFHVGRRLKCSVTAGTTYSRITASAYGAMTTITVVNDGSLTLDSGLSAVQYGILRNNVLSIPYRIATAAGTDTYTASVGATRLVTGDEYKINISSANTSATPTLNLDSLGAKTIKQPDGSAMVAEQLSGEHTFRYNGTDMIVLNPFNSNPVPKSIFTTAGDTIYATGANTPVRLGIGTARQVSRVNAGATAPAWDNQITLASPTAASGTTISYTSSIPAGVRRITFNLMRFSSNGTSAFLVQLGVAGVYTTSGYLTAASNRSASTASTAGFILISASVAVNTFGGSLILSLADSTNNKWSGSGSFSRDDGIVESCAGDVALSGVVDSIRITTVSGADTFDSGFVNFSYE